MTEFGGKIERKELDLSNEQEEVIEKEIQANLLEAESVDSAKEQMKNLIELEKNSKNGRAKNKIQGCMDILNLNCAGGNIGNEIASSVAQDLYPELYRNIALKRENITLEDLKKMAISLNFLGIDLDNIQTTDKKPYDGIDHINKEMLQSAFIKLIRLLPNERGE